MRREMFQPIEFSHSHGGAILWFITNDVGRCSFRVNFYELDPDLNDLGKKSAHECISHSSGESGGRKLHIFMWTQYSKLFKVLEDLWLVPVMRVQVNRRKFSWKRDGYWRAIVAWTSPKFVTKLSQNLHPTALLFITINKRKWFQTLISLYDKKNSLIIKTCD